ncbi:MAG: O-antigen ligase family protein [Candidatus Acidiferrales bacterium]
MLTSATSLFGLTLLGALAVFTAIRPRPALMCFIFCVPCPGLPDWLGFDPRLYWAFFLGAYAIYLSFSSGESKLPRSAVMAWLGFVALAAIILWQNHFGLAGEDLDNAFSFFRYFIAGSLVFLAFRQLVTTQDEMKRFVPVFALSVLCVGVEGLGEAIYSYAEGGGGRIVGVFGNANYLAGFLALSVSILLLFHRHGLSPGRSRIRTLLRVAIAAATLCCIATFSRGGTTALILGMSLHWFFLINPKMNVKRLVLALIPAALTIVILTTGQLMSVRFRVTYSDDPNTLDTATVNQGVEDLSRLEAALYAIDLFQQHPIFGSGIGTFAATNYKNTGNYVANHDTYLEVLTGTGLVGFALIAGIIWALVSDLTPPQRLSLGAVLGVTLAVGATTDLMQALEFFSVLALAHSFVSRCVEAESVEPLNEYVMSEYPMSEYPG